MPFLREPAPPPVSFTLADGLSLSESLWLPAHAPLSCRKMLGRSPQKPKASVGSTSLFLSATLLLAASPSSSFPHSRAGIREETLLHSSQTDAPPETHQWTETAALQLPPRSHGCVKSVLHVDKQRGSVPWALAALSSSLFSLPAQGAGSSNRSADLPQLVLAGLGEEKPQKSIGTAWKEIPPPPTLPGPDSNACSQTQWALLC